MGFLIISEHWLTAIWRPTELAWSIIPEKMAENSHSADVLGRLWKQKWSRAGIELATNLFDFPVIYRLPVEK